MSRTLITIYACQLLTLTAGSAAADEAPWGKGQTLAEKTIIEKTTLCTDGKSHYVGLAPHEHQGSQVFYGDGKKFILVPASSGLVGGESFFDPRFFNKTANDNFRGIDFRTYSSVDIDDKKTSCALRCGDHKTEFKIVPADKAEGLLSAATFAPNPRKRLPHALFRDQKGFYYLVDRGATSETEKSFRLYVGPKGALKKKDMLDVVNDSEGQLFSTKSGNLRMVVDVASDASWVEGKRKPLVLKRVPVEQNWQMIYNDLGVYASEQFGTPCDDF